jgi:hypothetical protein
MFRALPFRIVERHDVLDGGEVLGDPRQRVQIARIADENGGLGRHELGGLLVGAEPLIDQHQDAAAAGNAVVEQGIPGAVVRDDRDAVAATGSLSDPARDGAHLTVELGEGHSRTVGADDGCPIGHRGGRR